MNNESEKVTSPFSFKDRVNMFEKSELTIKPSINRSTKTSRILEAKETTLPIPTPLPTVGAVNSKSPIISNFQQSKKQTEVDKKLFSFNNPTSRPLPVPPKRDENKAQEINPQSVQLSPRFSDSKSPINQFPQKRSFGKLNEIKDQKPPSVPQPPPIVQSPPTAQLPPVPQPPPIVNSPPAAQLPPVPYPPPMAQLPPVPQPPPIVHSPPAAQLPPVPQPPPIVHSPPAVQLPPVPYPPPMAQLPSVPYPPPTTQLPPVPQPPLTTKLSSVSQQPPLAQSPPVVSTPPVVQPPPKLLDLKTQHKTLPIKPPLEFNESDDFTTTQEMRGQTSQQNFQTKKTLSPNGDKIIHPPLPPPPPSSLKTIENLSDLTLRPSELALPPLPPPPQSTSKLTKKASVLVGWVKPQNVESATNDKKLIPPDSFENKIKSSEPSVPNIKTGLVVPNIMESKANKIDDPDKPPPIVVPPPSLEVVRKIREREVSPSSSSENTKSVRSSVQSGDINNEDQYDEDEDFSSELWYFDISREEATKLMKNCSKKGTYLIRPSQNNQYVLMVRIETNEVKKFKIQKHNNGWILGDPGKAKKIHENLSNLVNYYLVHGIKFGTTTLAIKEPFPKK